MSTGFGRPIQPLGPIGSPNPNVSFPQERLDAAAAVVEPSLLDPAREVPFGAPDMVLNSARCRARLVVAALCGADTLAARNAQRLDALVVVPRGTLDILRMAFCDPRLAALLDAIAGTGTAARVLDDLNACD